jgi:hypothetical protein
VPLFYSHPWGEAQLANLNQLFIFPVFSIIVTLLNTYLTATIFAQNALMSRLILTTAAIYCFLSTYGLIRIILVVIY